MRTIKEKNQDNLGKIRKGIEAVAFLILRSHRVPPPSQKSLIFTYAKLQKNPKPPNFVKFVGKKIQEIIRKRTSVLKFPLL